jgi:hypothetical protein
MAVEQTWTLKSVVTRVTGYDTIVRYDEQKNVRKKKQGMATNENFK